MRRVPLLFKKTFFYKNNSTTNHKPRPPLPPRCPSPAPPPPPPPSIASRRPPTADRRPPTADRRLRSRDVNGPSLSTPPRREGRSNLYVPQKRSESGRTGAASPDSAHIGFKKGTIYDAGRRKRPPELYTGGWTTPVRTFAVRRGVCRFLRRALHIPPKSRGSAKLVRAVLDNKKTRRIWTWR